MFRAFQELQTQHLRYVATLQQPWSFSSHVLRMRRRNQPRTNTQHLQATCLLQRGLGNPFLKSILRGHSYLIPKDFRLFQGCGMFH